MSFHCLTSDFHKQDMLLSYDCPFLNDIFGKYENQRDDNLHITNK